MLWDPSKDKPRVEPLSLEGLVQWLETQPPETKYKYTQIYDCLWARYMQAIGNEKIEFNNEEFPDGVNEVVQAPTHLGYKGGIDDNERWNYKAALERGKKVLAKRLATTD
jgi:hypothetical protein